jgi:UDP-N-acetylglucosamine--N-acetylmuramyl-(pentapeptide) pyrophosphoryl-undecaprenol N-acetylglucosamine transferase
MDTPARAKTIVFTGGGTAGHVMPNLALAPRLLEKGWKLHYLGSATGPERGLAEGAGIPFHSLSTGKLRRYFSWRNFTDPLRVVKGALDAFLLLGKIKPDLVFSKGGFVSVPVVYAAALRRIPVVLHESDLTPGLANRLSLPFCSRICASFPETLDHLPAGKAVLTGTPIRAELFHGNRDAGLKSLGFAADKPLLLVMGGSLGSKAVNDALRANLDWMLAGVNVVHLCGKGWLDKGLEGRAGYRQFEFLGAGLADVLTAADRVVSRAGANSLFELLALRKPMLLVPLPGKASRGDQILNARSFAQRGLAHVLLQEDLNSSTLRAALELLEREEADLIANMHASDLAHGTVNVLAVIDGAVAR